MAAPVVVAKGRNLLADEIREIARWNSIPIVENRPLAHLLYRTVEVGQAVPPKLYAVIAEILAAIYRAQAQAEAAARARAAASLAPAAGALSGAGSAGWPEVLR
jgi:flagellar biosynthetic protein FlhB